MQFRHWDELASKCEVNLSVKNQNFTFAKLLKELDLKEETDQDKARTSKINETIEEISSRASKEFTIRKELDKMYRDWKILD